MTTNRPDCIAHYLEIQKEDNRRYTGSDELLSIGSSFGKHFGLERLGIHHETLPPGRRTSWPHAESVEEEFVYVIDGFPQVWIDGNVYDLVPGDAVGFPAGTGNAHTFLNNSESDVRLLVVGEASKDENRIFYPLHPERNREMADQGYLWESPPEVDRGNHDGAPDVLRKEMTELL
jgi:uncharacterized cupin superfamily protein